MKKYVKKKAGPKAGPKYRTPDYFKGSKFGGKGKVNPTQVKFNPAQFKVQHKG
jgi:hypothetical protein